MKLLDGPESLSEPENGLISRIADNLNSVYRAVKCCSVEYGGIAKTPNCADETDGLVWKLARVPSVYHALSCLLGGIFFATRETVGDTHLVLESVSTVLDDRCK